MRAREARLKARQRLSAAGSAEAERAAQLITAHLCGVEPGQLALYLDAPVDEVLLNQLLERLMAGEPLQYVLGSAGFMGLDFAVGPGALIPRADTEIIVEKAIALLAGLAAPRAADIGTGSGAIAVSLAHYLPQAKVHGVDISPAALAWAKNNARAQGVAGRCFFYQGDLCAPLIALDLTFDLIISNPPYVTRAEMAGLSAEVRREPQLALYGGPDGLGFYRRLARQAGPLLAPGGRLLIEHGWQQQQQVIALLTQAGWRVTEKLSDYGGRARGVLASAPC